MGDDHETSVVDEPPILEARAICKRFPGVRALHDVDLSLGRGEVLAVIGENGAGKSTLMKVLAGVQEADSGTVRVDGRPVSVDSVRAAQASGLALIHQELNLADNLDVASNIALGREPRTRFGFIDQQRIAREAAAVLSTLGLDIPTNTTVSQLTIGRQQLVEIAKALACDARILIMDEPTSSLSAHETGRLFEVIRDLRDRGVSVIYISHRLGEVREIADRVVVLRDGENAGELRADEITHGRMVQLMVGREISQYYERTTHEIGDVVLEVRDVRTLTWPTEPVSLSVRAGEIVGIAGLVGAGRTEVLEAIFGVSSRRSGRVTVDGREIRPGRPREAIDAGLALVPEDRRQRGLILEMAVRVNLSLARLGRDARFGFRDGRSERELGREMTEQLSIRTPHDRQPVGLLSGGNQQKVVLGRWLAMSPRVLLLDEPTRGVDVGAKAEIYRIMEQLAQRGVAVVYVSSEMEEILGMADRVIVMHEGRLTGELMREDLTEERVMHLATGGSIASGGIAS